MDQDLPLGWKEMRIALALVLSFVGPLYFFMQVFVEGLGKADGYTLLAMVIMGVATIVSWAFVLSAKGSIFSMLPAKNQ